MSPPAMVIVLLDGVGRVVNQHARALHECHEVLMPAWRTLVLRGRAELVVRDIDERLAPAVSFGEPIPERAPRVPDAKGLDVESGSLAAFLRHLPEVDRGVQLLARDGKHDRGHLVADDTIDARLQRLLPPDREVVSALEDGAEEGETLDVVPVRVCQEDVALDRRAVGALDERPAQLPQAGSGIEDDEPPFRRPDFDAGRVAAIAHGLRSGARDRSTSAPELDT